MLFLLLTIIGCDIELPVFKQGNGQLYEQGSNVSNTENSDTETMDTSVEEQEEQEETGDVEDTSAD